MGVVEEGRAKKQQCLCNTELATTTDTGKIQEKKKVGFQRIIKKEGKQQQQLIIMIRITQEKLGAGEACNIYSKDKQKEEEDSSSINQFYLTLLLLLLVLFLQTTIVICDHSHQIVTNNNNNELIHLILLTF
mmetsp:Transcript_20007/g.31463  ORF Transcript_20007/g.31463 Transcript_20007/m.31463 type:complete len:132 (-) Transcript_20007:6-401(-)